MVIFNILTLFPESFSYFNESIIKRAVEKGIVKINIHNLRDWSKSKHKVVDDRPFGGGPGMLMKVEPIYYALKDLGVYPKRDSKTKVLLTSAKGELWNQSLALDYSKNVNRLVIICGHYEGVDHRVVENLIDGEISIGNYILSGGELASQIIVDSTVRLMSDVLGNEKSLSEETDMLNESPEYPQYTRPSQFKTEEGVEWNVPDVLLSGNHKEMQKWRKDKVSQTPI